MAVAASTVDDFGDFNSSGETPTVSSAAAAENESEEEKNEDTEFIEFEAAESSTLPESSTSPESSTLPRDDPVASRVDEEFGDFHKSADATSAAQIEEAPSAMSTLAAAASELAFGDAGPESKAPSWLPSEASFQIGDEIEDAIEDQIEDEIEDGIEDELQIEDEVEGTTDLSVDQPAVTDTAEVYQPAVTDEADVAVEASVAVEDADVSEAALAAEVLRQDTLTVPAAAQTEAPVAAPMAAGCLAANAEGACAPAVATILTEPPGFDQQDVAAPDLVASEGEAAAWPSADEESTATVVAESMEVAMEFGGVSVGPPVGGALEDTTDAVMCDPSLAATVEAVEAPEAVEASEVVEAPEVNLLDPSPPQTDAQALLAQPEARAPPAEADLLGLLDAGNIPSAPPPAEADLLGLLDAGDIPSAPPPAEADLLGLLDAGDVPSAPPPAEADLLSLLDAGDIPSAPPPAEADLLGLLDAGDVPSAPPPAEADLLGLLDADAVPLDAPSPAPTAVAIGSLESLADPSEDCGGVLPSIEPMSLDDIQPPQAASAGSTDAASFTEPIAGAPTTQSGRESMLINVDVDDWD